MPAILFKVAWPDGEEATYYSPSTIVLNFLQEGATYQQPQFRQIAASAFNAASDRVLERFGYRCSAASAELEKIQTKLDQLSDYGVTGLVEITQLNPDR